MYIRKIGVILFLELKSFDQKVWKDAKVGYDSAILKLKEIEPFELDLRQMKTPKDRADVWNRLGYEP